MLLLHSRVVGTVFGAPKKLINWPRPLFRPKTDHADGSGMFIPDPGSDFFPCRIGPVSIPDPGSSSKNFSILTPKKWFLSS